MELLAYHMQNRDQEDNYARNSLHKFLQHLFNFYIIWIHKKECKNDKITGASNHHTFVAMQLAFINSVLITYVYLYLNILWLSN